MHTDRDRDGDAGASKRGITALTAPGQAAHPINVVCTTQRSG